MQSSRGDADRGGTRRHRHLVARARPGEDRGGRAAGRRGRADALRVGRSPRPRRAGGSRAPAARRHRRGLLHPEPLFEPDERLPREVQVLRVRRDPEAGPGLHDLCRRARRGRRQAAGADGLHRDPHGQRREPARRLRLLRRHRARAARGAARRAPQALHGVRDPPHDDDLRAHARGGAARAQGRRARLAAGRRRRDLRRPRAAVDRSRQGAPRPVVRDARHRAPPRHPDALHDALRARRDVRGAGRPPAADCATSRTEPAASSPSSRSRSTPRTPSSSGAAGGTRPAPRTSRCSPSRG